jgi:DNA-binding transcriptional LysR family regulator
MEIDLTRLTYFLAVAEELHFKRAADRLRITPPPLSKQIKLLERELGGELFEREYHQVRLTPLGEALIEPAAASWSR